LDFKFSNLRYQTKERKVRTPKGSEPANGGASVSNLRFQIEIPDEKRGDDKCNRKQTSQ